MRSRSRLPVTLALALLLPRPALAQDAPTENKCAQAARFVARGHPAVQQDDAYRTLHTCPAESAQVFSGVFEVLRTSTDTMAFKWLVNNGTIWRDGTIFSAALAVANNPSATAAARAYSLVALDRLVDRGNYHPVLHPDADTDPAAVRASGCTVTTESEAAQQPGAPEP
jgi:hypothetical protein